MSEERVTLDVLLRKGEYPVIIDLIKLGQDIKNAIYFLRILETRVDEAVTKHTGLKIEKRMTIGRRKEDIEKCTTNTDTDLSSQSPSE